jgi:NADPH:quinone reductase-like Zn-dependent oxidoreductase
MKEDPAAHARALTRRMHAVRVHQFGGLEAIVYEEVSRPVPGAGQVLVRVKAAGVGPWDAWVRAGKSVLPQPLPLVLGSDLAGVIEEVGPGISNFRPGEAVFGVTNAQFTGAYAEYAACKAGMIAKKPRTLSFVEAASAPVVAVTAWQMLFDEAKLKAGQVAIIQGAAGSVGRYAVMLSRTAGIHVIASALQKDLDQLRELGANEVTPSSELGRYEGTVDAAIDLVGGPSRSQLLVCVKPGGVLVTAVPPPPTAEEAASRGVKASFMLVHVETRYLDELTARFEAGQIRPNVGTVLPLADARSAHEMLDGIRPASPGKIVLELEPGT